MSKQTTIVRLHAEEHGTLDYDPSVPCIIATHIGFATDKEFKDFLNLGLEYATEKKKECANLGWLADTLLMDGNTSAEWAVSDWNPRVFAEGIHHLAFVSPKDIFADVQIQEYVTLSSPDEKIKTASFEDIESAKQWLRNTML